VHIEFVISVCITLLVQWVGVLGIKIHQKCYLCVFHWFFVVLCLQGVSSLGICMLVVTNVLAFCFVF
jgi:hypothetical protein